MPGWWGNPAAAGLRRSEVADTVCRLVSSVVRGEVTTGTSLYLEGPPGIGKSHLIRDAVEVSGTGTTVLRAAADQERRTDAFAVMADLVGGIPLDVNPAEYVLDRIDSLCAGGPVVAWVDDAHHADEATLTMLRRVVWSARALPLAVLITARPLPVRERLQLMAAQADVGLRLPPMDALMVERVVFDHLGRWPGPVLRRALAAAAGNPLFVIEIIRSLRAADLLIAQSDGGTVDVQDSALPRFDGLDRVVRLHLAQLDGAVRDALATLAVCGAEVALTELADVMFAVPDDLRGPLSRAATAGLVRLGSDGRVDFAHDVYREVAYDDVPESLRRLTHARIAELAERRGAGSVRAAQHRLRGNDGNVADDPETLAALREAAASTEQYAPEVAADLLEMTEDAPGGEPDEAVLLRRVEDLYAGGRGAAAERLVRERIGGVADRTVAAALQAVLIRQLINRGEVEGVLAVIDRTTNIPGLPVTVRTTLAALRTWIALLAGQSVALADIDRMRSDMRSEVDGTDAVDGLPTLVLVEACQAFLAGRPGEALERFDWINSFRQTVGGGRLDGSAQVFRPWAAMILGGPRVGLDEVQAARRDHERDVRWSDPYLGFVAGAAAMLAAEWDDAVAELDTAMELADETGSGWLSMPTGCRCYIDAHRGDTVAARARLEAFRHRGLPIQFGLDMPGIAELAVLEAEGATAAAATLARTLWSAGRARPGRGMVEHSVDIMRVGMMTLQQRLTAQIVDDLTGDLDHAQMKDRRGPEPVVRLQAVSLAIKGMSTTDPDLLGAAAELFGTQHWEWHRAQTLEELACAAAARKDRSRANEAMDAAIAMYERVGARTDRDRLLARTRALGLRRGSRESQRAVTHGWASLTATESRVTTLIRDGLTNREIGARLYISPRTVQTHVAHILTKTALRSRVEVATAAASHLARVDALADH